MRQTALIISIGVALCLSCSNGNPSLAGGAGAGNPGSATFAMVIDTADSAFEMPKRLTGRGNHALTVLDAAGNTVYISEVLVTVQSIWFEQEERDRDEDKSAENGQRGNSAHGSSLAGHEDQRRRSCIQGPFLFDVLSGESEPAARIDSLAPGDYIGVRVHVAADNKGEPGAEEEPACCAVSVSGSVAIGDSLRDFSILAPINEELPYKQGQTVTVAEGDTVKFTLSFLLREWFSAIALSSCDTATHDRGAILIGGPSSACPKTMVAFKLSFIHSGRLNGRKNPGRGPRHPFK